MLERAVRIKMSEAYVPCAYERVYLSCEQDETADFLAPPLTHVRALIEAYHGHGHSVTLLFPPLSHAGMLKAEVLLTTVAHPMVDEVVCNDFGLLNYVHARAYRPILGRFFAHQRTDPQLLELYDEPYQRASEGAAYDEYGGIVSLKYRPLTPNERNMYATCLPCTAHFAAFLREYCPRVERAELNSAPFMPLSTPDWLHISVYTPDVLVAVHTQSSPPRALNQTPLWQNGTMIGYDRALSTEILALKNLDRIVLSIAQPYCAVHD